MKIMFFDAKESTVEWVLSTTGLCVIPNDEVMLHMKEVVVPVRHKKPAKTFFWNELDPFVLTLLVVILVGLLLYFGENNAGSLDPKDILIRKVFFILLVVIVVIGTPWLMWRSDRPLCPEAEGRQWEKTECIEWAGNEYVGIILDFIKERSLVGFHVFVHTHPSVPERWYSIAGHGDSGNQAEYFFASSGPSSLD